VPFRSAQRGPPLTDESLSISVRLDSLGLDVKADFALAFWMLHEVPNPFSFFKEMRSVLKASGKLLVSEPAIHVTAKRYAKTIEMAISTGFKVIAEPKIFLSRSALLAVN
jgi:hypothetical protein